MNYCEVMREKIGNAPLIIVRPSVAILNSVGEILLYQNEGGNWGIPGGILQLNESVEECIKRTVLEDIGLKLNSLSLIGVYSGAELINKVEGSGDEYHTVAIGYICTDFENEICPDQNQLIKAQFFQLSQLPKDIDPFIKSQLKKLKF
ncbi:DNA mismatch repair protein MutT [Bacillus sp. AFS001701]|uniref:NUDIX domain-containing protein n=1 Tax=Bacillus sp. AFS001701 TaxID=2033480 RepID=UPI000BF940AF|nr:NUDIX domain-containing protein [Bacillus sp. AFS001701]PET64410.1 DNA mismatch repair protein MutT [Bacillus sp. AFS001701]